MHKPTIWIPEKQREVFAGKALNRKEKLFWRGFANGSRTFTTGTRLDRSGAICHTTLHITMIDELESAYQTLRGQIFHELADAAREKNLMRVERMTQKLRELEAWWSGDTSPIDEQIPVKQGLPNNMKGKTPREAWVQARIDQGILLKKLRGAIYQAPVGQIGIAFANEWPKRPNHFLLGLPDGSPLVAAALLCQRPTGISDLVLPSELMSDVWTKLSRSNGQVKINVKWLPNGTVSLLVPKHSWRNISKYVGNYASLVGGTVKQRSEELTLWR